MSKNNVKKVLKPNNLPTRLPVWSTATSFLLLERFDAPQWLWGALGFFFLLFGVELSTVC